MPPKSLHLEIPLKNPNYEIQLCVQSHMYSLSIIDTLTLVNFDTFLFLILENFV